MSFRRGVSILALIAAAGACAANERKAVLVPATTTSDRIAAILRERAPDARMARDTSTRIIIRPFDQSRPGVQPLLVVDGMPMTAAEMQAMEIDPRHISEIYVLKSTVAVPFYGERARDGAVVITTRRL